MFDVGEDNLYLHPVADAEYLFRPPPYEPELFFLEDEVIAPEV